MYFFFLFFSFLPCTFPLTLCVISLHSIGLILIYEIKYFMFPSMNTFLTYTPLIYICCCL